ncbi:hypothetical protein [Deinococcus multiflagellatus]|uniref:Uncharacterized protein n=1 Tax=Deinococcus multiflagellatus TaxID=1656887 RepID=A0ABW1ZL35_9DEIO
MQWTGEPVGQQRGEITLGGGDGSVSTGTFTLSTAAGVQPGTYTLFVSDSQTERARPLTVTVTPPVQPRVTAVRLSADPAQVPSGGQSVLSAQVDGTGAFDPALTWTVVSGGGTLSAASGPRVTLTAPGGPATVTVRATSVANPEVSGTVTVQVAAPPPPPPPPSTRLGGQIRAWPQESGEVTLESGGGSAAVVLSRASVGTGGTFDLSLPTPSTLDPLTIAPTSQCTVDLQPGTLRAAQGSLYVRRAAQKFYLETENPSLASLVYVDQPGRASAQCTATYTLPDGTVMTEQYDYRYTFAAAGWYPVYLTYSQTNPTTTVYTFTSGPLSSAPTSYVVGSPVP